MQNVARVIGLALVLVGCEGPQPAQTAPVYQEVPMPPRKPTPPVERRKRLDGQLRDLDQRIKSLQNTVTEHEQHGVLK